ncbi:hypothetical protein FRC06_002258 [Ceratobasidium sp. 370]|nr:hypothetical protein FRC06_002258 [Ceratobasidium sp. 370]
MDQVGHARLVASAQAGHGLASYPLLLPLPMPRGTHKAVRDRIQATAATNQSKTRTPMPEPTTSSGVTRGNALFDTPPRGSESARCTSGRRSSRSTERGALWTPPTDINVLAETSRCKSRQHGELSQHGKQRKAAERARSQSQGRKSNGDTTDIQTDVDEVQIDTNDVDEVQTDTNNVDMQIDTQIEAPAPARRGREKKSVTLAKPKPRGRSLTTRKGNQNRPPTRSPTPGSTDVDPEDLDFVTGKTPAGSQYTYIYETVDHDTLVRIAEKKLGTDFNARLGDCSTQDIIAMLQVHEADQPIKLLPPAPISVGGGWHGNHPAIATPAGSSSNPVGPRPAKRASDASDSQVGKRARTDPVENTDTEPESDKEVTRPPTAGITSAPPGTTTRPGPNLPLLQPQPSTSCLPPPPTRTSTPTTILESQPSARPSLSNLHVGSSTYSGLPVPRLPMLLSPPRGPAHTRLQTMLLNRVIDRIEADEVFDEPDEPDEYDELDDEYDTSNPTQRDPATPVRNSKNKTTYGKTRSHRHSDPGSLAATAAPPAQPNSPTMSDAALIEIECARARLEKARAAADSRSRIPHRSSATQPLQSRVARSLIGAVTHPDLPAPRRPREKENRRLDPISAARTDMVAFNDEVARGNTESFVRSVTHQSKRPRNDRTGRCRPTRHRRSLNDLLDDNEEELAQAQALAEGRAPIPGFSRRRRNRKKKPLARDFSGLKRQVLILAKLHLFAFALAEGIYQTRLTFMEWAAEIHNVTWTMLLPNIPYEAATQEELEVMVNYLATLRGKVKDRLRPLIAHIHALEHCVRTQHDIQDNLDTFHLVYPNSFHCKTYSPRDSHYENPDIACCIAAAFFYAPSAVGLQFPDYFDEMPLTIVAFILAIWQFCLEEWSSGYFESRDLGASHMLDKYEAHLAGLKALRDVAPQRLSDLQTDWRDYTKSYSGASFIRTHRGQAVTLHSELRPDTPRPERHCRRGQVDAERAVDHDELDSRLTQTARLASLQQLAIERGVLDETNTRAETPDVFQSCPSTPPVEYNKHGRITARSKGKGQTN